MTQITEDYVSPEIAKLLKEKKALIDYTMGYDEDGNLCNAMKCGVIDGKRVCILNGNDKLLMAPTQSMVMRWLREVHKIFVEPFVSIDLNGKYHYCFRLLNSACKDILDPKDLLRIDFKDTYEEACQAALLYVLKNLI